MSKRGLFSEAELDKLERQISQQLQVSEYELEQAMRENEELLSQHEKSMDGFQRIFNNPEEDRLVEEELRVIEAEMGVSSSTKDKEFQELEEQIRAMPDRPINDLEMEQLLSEIDEIQTEVMVDRSRDVSTLLKVHSQIANHEISRSSNPEEVEYLTNFSKQAQDLSNSIERTLSGESRDLNKEETQGNCMKFYISI